MLAVLALVSILGNLYHQHVVVWSSVSADDAATANVVVDGNVDVVADRPQSNRRAHLSVVSARQSVDAAALASFQTQIGLVTIAYGDEARAFALNLLRSVAVNAHADLAGVFVFTDDADFFRSANYGLHLTPVRFLERVVDPLPTVADAGQQALSSGRRRKLSIKWLKTQIFKHTDLEFAVYVDADVVVGAPLRDFFSLCFERRAAPLAAFPDSGNTGSPYHTGVVFSSRNSSAALLERWAAAIVSGAYQGDQKALADVVDELQIDRLVSRFPLDSGLVRLQQADAYFAFIDASLVRKSRKAIFLHTSKYRLENPIKFGVSLADVRAYMKRVVHIVWDIDDIVAVDGHDQSVKLALAKVATRDAARANDTGPTLDNTAIVTIAVGEKSRAFGRLLLRSFELHAEFAGPLFIVTDDVEYFETDAPDLAGDDDDDDGGGGGKAKKSGVRAGYRRKALSPNVRFLRFGNGSCGELVLPEVAVHMKRLTPEELAKKAKSGAKSGDDGERELLDAHNRERLQIKWLKTQFFRLLPAEFRYALFMDSDMIIERPLHHLLADCFDVHRRRIQAAHVPAITLYRDFGNTGMPYHTGVLFMGRAESQALLDRWGAVILDGWTKSDQKCINQTIDELGLQEQVGFLDLDKDNFAFVNGSVIADGRVFTLLHATFYRLSMADKFDFSREAFALYLKEKVHLTAVGAVLELVPDAAEVRRRQAERERQLKKGIRECKYVETSWNRYVVQWCP